MPVGHEVDFMCLVSPLFIPQNTLYLPNTLPYPFFALPYSDLTSVPHTLFIHNTNTISTEI